MKKALASDPSDQESRYALGQTLLATGQAAEGRQELDKYEAIRQQVGSAEANYKTALARLAEGKIAEAEKLLHEAVRLAPMYGPALNSLGTLLLEHGSADKALPFLERAVRANPLNAAHWYSLAKADLKLGKLTGALTAANHAVTLNDDEAPYQRLVADIQKRLKK